MNLGIQAARYYRAAFLFFVWKNAIFEYLLITINHKAMESKREQTNEEKINAVIIVMDVILLAYKQANEFGEIIPVELINDLKEGIEILKEGGVNLDQVIERMKAHVELIEKNDSFLSGGVSSKEGDAHIMCPLISESEIERVVSSPCYSTKSLVGINKCHMGGEGFFASPNVSFNKKDEDIDTFSLIQYSEKQVEEEGIVDNLLDRHFQPLILLDEFEDKEFKEHRDRILKILDGSMNSKQVQIIPCIDEVSEITEENFNSLNLPIKPRDLTESDFTKPNFESFDYSPTNEK